MGVVWTAIHLVTKRRVAIKLLRASGSEDAASRARLLREARASCAVEHPSILPVLDVIDADGAPALVMELLEGESLRERLARAHGSALGVRETSAILAPVAAALAAAHAARIVHRDIKPENIFLVRATDARGAAGKPTVKVLDFGIAKIVATEEATTSLTESGAMLGTPYYMAPEQAFGERDVGAAADAWSLGIVLYECLAGVRPTQADNLGQVIKRITQDPMTPVEDVVADVPAELARVIRGLLVRDAAARETDLAAVAATLARLAGNTDDRGDADAVGAVPTRGLLPETALGAPRRGGMVLAAVVLAIGAAAVLVGLATRRDATRDEALAGGRTVPSALPSASVTTSGSSTTSGWALAVGPVTSVTSSAVVATETARVGTGAAPARRVAGGDAGASTNAGANAAGGDDGGTTGPGHIIIKTPF